MPKQSLSLKIWFIIVLALGVTFSFYQKVKDKQFIVSDGCAYYSFLPAAFIYHDLDFKYVKNLPRDLYLEYWLTDYPGKDYRLSKMTIGVALLMLPFFLIGHAYAIAFDYPLTGFSHPYQDLVAMAALFYCIAGLFFIRKTLLKFFSEEVTSISLILLIAATTLFNFSLSDTSMSHVYSFFSISLMVWFTIRWHETFSSKHFILLCFILGFITLIRPVNLLTVLFPLLFAIQNSTVRKQKSEFIKQKGKLILKGVIIFFVPIIPQLALWKFQTGSWVFDSYVGEHFFFNNPHIIDFLVGFRSGWFIYTPVMIFSVAGIWISLKHKLPFAPAIIFFLPVTIYVLSCWWCFTYAGTFGMRPMVDFYSILILPTATFIYRISLYKWIKFSFCLLFIFFIWLNLFQQLQFQKGILHYSDMTAKAYVSIFGKSYYPSNYDQLVDPFDVENAKAGKPLRNMRRLEDFGYIPLGEEVVKIKACNGKYFCVDPDLNLMLVANSDIAQTRETFALIHLNANRCVLKAWNGCYLFTLDWNEEKAQTNIISQREVLDYVDLGDNKFSLKSVNGKYLSLEFGEPYFVYATSPVITERSIFTKEK